MSIKASISTAVTNQTRKFPCLRTDQYNNVLLFKDEKQCTIIFSYREENIGMQYQGGEYNVDELKPFTHVLTLTNSENIDD